MQGHPAQIDGEVEFAHAGWVVCWLDSWLGGVKVGQDFAVLGGGDTGGCPQHVQDLGEGQDGVQPVTMSAHVGF